MSVTEFLTVLPSRDCASYVVLYFRGQVHMTDNDQDWGQLCFCAAAMRKKYRAGPQVLPA